MNRTDIHSNLCDSLKELYRTKNKDYGDSFSKIRSKYGNTAILVRLHDKLSRVEQLMLNGNQQVKDESIDDTLRDLANYALLELTEREYDRCQSTEEDKLSDLIDEALKLSTIEELKERLGVVSPSELSLTCEPEQEEYNVITHETKDTITKSIEYINTADTCCMCGELKELDDSYYCNITGATILSKYSRKPSNCPEVSTNEDK